ncbi:NAD-dependent epimerase/dehydratase family protein [Chloroflexota bacterium]
MRALLIGGTGPTGPSVVEGLLARGYDVSIFHRGTHEVSLPKDVEHIHGDPHFLETLNQALGIRTFDLAVVMYGRLRFIAEAMCGRVPRMVSVGGTGVYRGWMNLDPSAPVFIPTPEDAPLQDDPDVDKFTYRMVEAESVIMRAHQASHYNATHFRYPGVYGPRQLAPREWSIIRRILDRRKRLILPDSGLAIRSHGFAKNMAHAVLLAIDKPDESAGQIYNIRDEELFTVRDWIRTIGAVMNHEFEFVEMPYTLARPARVYSGRSRHQILDITKVQRELGYHDIVPAAKGIEYTVNWYLEHKPDPGGEVEQQLRDPFDYEAENLLIDNFLESVTRIKELAPPRLGFRHPYAHPKSPDKLE